MPNYVKNVVKAEGIRSLPVFGTYLEGEDAGLPYLDFEKIIPMPDDLRLTSGTIEDLAIEAVYRKLLKCHDKWAFQRGKPVLGMPEERYQTLLKNGKESEEQLQELGLKYLSNIIHYGCTSWYDWCCDNWGTKWNAGSTKVLDGSTVTFETAWANPEPVMRKLSSMFPDIRFEHWWADEDTGSNDGHAVYLGGEALVLEEFENCSQQAYETFIFCWGAERSRCLAKDEQGNWYHKDCETCHDCD